MLRAQVGQFLPISDLWKRLVELQDAERRRLATELHDIVGQNLSALVTELALIRSRLSAAKEPDLHKSLADATLLAKQSVEAVRKVMAQLRPPGLDELGLPAALRWHASAACQVDPTGQRRQEGGAASEAGAVTSGC